MKTFIKKQFSISKLTMACWMTVLGLFCSMACLASAPTYTLTDLGILPGYNESNAVAVNNAGQIAGNLFDSNGVEHAFIYSNGTMTVLGVVSGSDRANAVSMNNAGQIVGSMGDGNGDSVAFSYFNGNTVALGCNLCGFDSFANDVNDSGEVVGDKFFFNPNRLDACIFPNTDLGIVSGYTSSEAFAINNSGQIVLGETNGFAGQELFLYNGTFQDLGISVAGSGAGGTRPCTINNSGQIIGSFPYNGGNTGHPFLYSNGSVTDLGPVVGNAATLYDINNSGQIVGTTLPSGSSAFVYYINGTNYLLRDLSISGGTGWVFYDARGINDSGQIVGRGYNNNSNDRRTRAFLLTPTGGPPHPAFFNGETALGNGVYYLQFPNGTPFGYYAYLTDQRFIYHFDMGYEYWFDANDGHNGIFFYDFMSNHFFYTSPSFPFPYLYDFSLNTVLYYYPDPNHPGHYTTNPRYFYNFATGQIITM